MDEVTAQILARLDALQKDMGSVRDTVDKFGDALVQMAKTEVRVTQILEQQTLLFRHNAEIQKRLSEMEKINATQGQSIGFFERIGWVIAGTIASIVAFFVRS